MNDLDDLYRRVAEANSAAEQAIKEYDDHNAYLLRGARGDRGKYHVDKRDDFELASLGNKAAFRTSTAIRLASTLQIELLTALLHLAELRDERQRA